MEEILIISNYYPPEKGAAANRIEQLALQLYKKKYAVTVICPLGNYPYGSVFQEYKGKFLVSETLQNINVKRLWIFPSISKNWIVRLFSITSFSGMLFFYLLFKKTPKKVIVQSPPLLVSFFSVLVLYIKKKKIILNVSDLWPLAALELKALKKNSFSHRFSLFLERFIYKKATLVLGQSDEIISHIQSIYPKKECHLYRNLPSYSHHHKISLTPDNESIRIFYAGLLGVAQGIYDLCEKITFDTSRFELHVIGDGAEKLKIQEYIRLSNKKIFFHEMMERGVLHEKIKSFDLAIVPLKTRIYGSVPSKIFEYSLLGFPILYFGGGEGEAIILENNLGWVVPVGDYLALNKTIDDLDKTTINLMKNTVLETARKSFDINYQIDFLMAKNVF